MQVTGDPDKVFLEMNGEGYRMAGTRGSWAAEGGATEACEEHHGNFLSH